MNKYPYKVIILFLLILQPAVLLQAFSSEPPHGLKADDLTGMVISREENYDGSSLWGYINGGADIYLEYGFDNLLAQEVKAEGETFRIDIYKMASPEASYGIFSVSRFRCQSDTLSRYSCITQYQVLLSSGRFYISVANESGSPKAQSTALKIAGILLKRNPSEESFSPPSLFLSNEFGPFLSDLIYLNGKLGVQNSLTDWIELFEKTGKFSMYYLPLNSPEGNSSDLAYIFFTSSGDRQAFIKAAGLDIQGTEEIKDAMMEIKSGTGMSKIAKPAGSKGLILFSTDLPVENQKGIIERIQSYK